MTLLSPTQSRARVRRRFLVASAWFALFMAASLLDQMLWRVLRVDNPERLRDRDWWWALRTIGYLPLWMVIAFCLDSARASRLPDAPGDARGMPGLAALLSAALSGAIAELFKLIIARERPGDTGEYVWRGVGAGFFDSHNLGIPSSHAAVAFGGAFILAGAFGRLSWIALLGAAGCGLSRILKGDHFTSDVIAGAWIAYACSRVFLSLAWGDRGRHHS